MSRPDGGEAASDSSFPTVLPFPLITESSPHPAAATRTEPRASLNQRLAGTNLDFCLFVCLLLGFCFFLMICLLNTQTIQKHPGFQKRLILDIPDIPDINSDRHSGATFGRSAVSCNIPEGRSGAQSGADVSSDLKKERKTESET